MLLNDNSASPHHPRFPCWSFDCVDRNTDSLTCSAASGRTGASAGSSVWGSCLSGPWCSTLSLGCTWKRLIFVIVILPSTQDSLSRVLRCTGKVLLYGKPQNLAAPNSDCYIESLPLSHTIENYMNRLNELFASYLLANFCCCLASTQRERERERALT